MGGTVVLNASYEVLTSVSWQRAVRLVVLGLAEVFEGDATREIRSQRLTLPYPKVIRLLKYVYVKVSDRALRRSSMVSKRRVLERDKFTCAYCTAEAKTVDHVLPASRGGGFTWENLVAACQPCNNSKDDRTPEEAGMTLLWQPYCPDNIQAVQQSVWRALQAA